MLLALVACSSKPTTTTTPTPTTPPPGDTAGGAASPTGPAAPVPPAVKKEVLSADTPRTTAAGNTFTAPAGWSIWTQDAMTVVEAPEGDSRIVLFDTKADSAEAALDLAWRAYKPAKPWKRLLSMPQPDNEGWTKIMGHQYQTSPNEKRVVAANTMFANGTWTVVIADLAQATAEKRGGQLAVIFSKFLPKGGAQESFKGKTAAKLDAKRLAELTKWIEHAQQQLKVPGVALGIVQDGKVVFAGGFGVRELGKPAKVDADTKFIIASNTKALTTLMLGKLVDEKKLTWDTKATDLLPKFKLGDADTTSKVLVKHLICACTGMPRQDLEWLLEFKDLTPDGALAALGTMQPTSKFGELFQYSNPLAAAAGFIGGHVAFPKLELGKAYDEAMRTRVFAPLGMTNTTFDYKKAQTGNYAAPHAPNQQDEPAIAVREINYAVIPVRPAGGAWSTVRDVLKYVQMELDEGKVKGKPYISKDTLMARRAPQVSIGQNTTYGMGLTVNTKYDVTVVNHGGDMIGYHSDMMWLPEHGVGAVVLTNGDPGWTIRGLFQRKLLEVLFDGKPEADARLAASAKSWFESRATERKLYEVPARAEAVAKLGKRYASAALGEIVVSQQGKATIFDFGEWKSEVASKQNPDGTLSFVTIAPGMEGVELVVAEKGGARTLVLRDSQHEYVFDEKK